ncbi:MAG: TolC family protein [Acidobacteriales bacterium]|nr:TolC family protein [Terriglobales bacterium]
MRNRLLLLALVAAAASAQPVLKLDELINDALRANPEILAAQKRYEAARQRPGMDSALPDPMLSVGYASAGKPWPLAGIGTEPTANVGLMVSQEFPFPGKRKLRGDMAAKMAEAEWSNYEETRLSVISRLKQAYHRLHHAHEMIGILTRNRDLLIEYLRVAEARYSVGKAAQQDIFKAQTARSILEARLIKIEQERRAREAEINTQLARDPRAPLGAPPEIPPGTLAVTLDELFRRASQVSPALMREQKLIERTELAVNLARKDYYPDYTLSAGYFNMGQMPDMYQFRVDFKLPAWFHRKQQAGVTEQVMNLSQARRSWEVADQAIHYRIREEYLMAETSERLMRLYADTVLPQARLALDSSLASYETGAVDFLTVLNNFTTRLDYEMNYHEEMLSFHLALVRLEEMTALKLID